MKLYYATGACSLSPRIIAFEAGISLDAERVDLGKHVTESGADYYAVNPKGYVPALRLDNGELLTEGVAMAQYLADLAPRSGLVPPAGTPDRYRLQEWLTYISSEIHKAFSPWLFDPQTPDSAKEIAKGMIGKRFAELDKHFAANKYLMGERFTAADAYCFNIVGWSKYVGIDLKPYPHLQAFMDRIAARPKVKDAMRAEGLEAA